MRKDFVFSFITRNLPLHFPDPATALSHHLVMCAFLGTLLCECQYKDGKSVKTFDKSLLMNMCNEVWGKDGIQHITGHSFRIGGTTGSLMASIDPDIVNKMGRWSSDAVLRYWRNVNGIFETHASSIKFVDFTP
jgi:hypothetical protein